MATQCPNCSASLLPLELAEGWCESCGKKLPASLAAPRERGPVREQASPDPPPRSLLDSANAVTNAGCWLLFLLALGIGLVGTGYRDVRLASDASASPAECRLEDLEAGRAPPGSHVRLGPHVRLWSLSIYTMLEKDREKSDPEVRSVLVPVFSPDHPFYREWKQVREDGKNVRLDKLRVVMRTTAIKRRSRIPLWTEEKASLVGLVVSDFDKLDPKELALLREEFPGANFNGVLIIEEDEPPPSFLVGSAKIGGGVLVLAFLVLVLRNSWPKRAA
ncbi:MAG: hypothetical protein K2W96_21835 [Gemmataceae bacterium]|nr:hypothetical protein [Gemmataceae bacterium]